MATYEVLNTNASGPGSLAAALAAAKDGDTVQFTVDGTITLSGNTALPAGSVFFDTTDALGTAHDVSVGGGALTDAGALKSALAKTGAGTLTLTNTANTYSGGTTLSGGSLSIPDPDPNSQYTQLRPVTTLGNGAIAFDGGTLSLDDVRLGNSATIDAKSGSIFIDSTATYLDGLYGAEIDGDINSAPGMTAGTFMVSAASSGNNSSTNSYNSAFLGGLDLTGNDIFAGGLTIENTSVSVGNGGAAGTLAGNVTGSTAGVGYGSLYFDHSTGTTATFAGDLSGDIGFGTGGLTVLTGTNTYSRATQYDFGTLRAGRAGAFSPDSQVVADSSDNHSVGTLDLAGFDESIGGLVASSFVHEAFDVVTNSGSTPATLTIAAGGPSTPYATQDNQNTGGYGRYFDGFIEDGNPSQGGGTLAVDVAGNLNLSQASTYTGGTRIEAGGTLTLLSESAQDSGNAFGSVPGAIVDNGTLAFVALAYGGPATPRVVANAISGSGGVTMTVDPGNAAIDGIVVLTGANTYTGATLVDHGTLQGGVANAFGTDSAVTVNGNTFGHGATLDLDGNAQAIGALAGDSGGVVTDSGAAAVLTLGGGDGSGTFFGTIRDGAGAIALVKTGAGTETLAGTDSYSGGTTIAAGTLEFTSDAALPPGSIAFAGNGATLKLDAAPANGSTFADPLSGLAPGDALDLAGLAFAPGASATVSGGTLAVTSGGTTEYFSLTDATAASFAVTQDAAGGTLVTAVVPGQPPGPAPSDSVTVDPEVGYSRGVFTLTGTASSTAGVRSVEISAVLNYGTREDLGAATVNADGTFTFQDTIGGNRQGFIEATETDGAGGQAVNADPLFSLMGGIGPGYEGGRQGSYSADGSRFVAVTRFGPRGSEHVRVEAAGQTLASAYDDTFLNHDNEDTTFVFEPGHSQDVVNGFRIDGVGHDTLSFLGADFGRTPQAQLGNLLRHTADGQGGLVITDPTSGDTVQLGGLTKSQLVQNARDIAFR